MKVLWRSDSGMWLNRHGSGYQLKRPLSLDVDGGRGNPDAS